MTNSTISTEPSSGSGALQDFVPEEDWPRVSVMLEGFGAPSLPDSEALVGRTITIDYDIQESATLEFLTPNQIRWARGGAVAAEHSYRAVQIRESLFYIDVIVGSGTRVHDVSIALDVESGHVTTADTYLVDRGGEVRTHTDFLAGRVRGTGLIEPRQRTDALVGKRIYYRYSEVEAYEHIYLNAGTFVWQCVKGGEKGLADVEESRAYRISDDLVIFFWTETVMPVDSFLVIDLKAQRSIGRMFCWDAPALDTVHLPFDSRFTVLNETAYPED